MPRVSHEDEPWEDEELLRELYEEEMFTVAEIAEDLDTSVYRVRSRMEKFGIERRQGGFIPKSLEERFWPKVDTGDEDECWLWTADSVSQSGEGYGYILGKGGREGRMRHAHRVSYELENGEIPEGGLVLHKCDVKLCVNPNHLYAGDKSDNARDLIERGDPDWHILRGEDHPRAKLTGEDVSQIRQGLGEKTHQELADEFGVSASLIDKISRGVLWRGV